MNLTHSHNHYHNITTTTFIHCSVFRHIAQPLNFIGYLQNLTGWFRCSKASLRALHIFSSKRKSMETDFCILERCIIGAISWSTILILWEDLIDSKCFVWLRLLFRGNKVRDSKMNNHEKCFLNSSLWPIKILSILESQNSSKFEDINWFTHG